MSFINNIISRITKPKVAQPWIEPNQNQTTTKEEPIDEDLLMGRIKSRMPGGHLKVYLQSKKLWSPALQMLVLVIGLSVGLYLTQKTTFYQPSASNRTSLSLPATLTVHVNQQLTIPITLNTDETAVNRIDVKVRYDPNLLSLTKVIPVISNGSLTDFSPVNQNGVFTPGEKCDGNTCLVDFSVQAPDRPYRGITVIASLLFTPRQSAVTDIIFVSTPGQTTDSNIFAVADPVKDILARTTNLLLTITP